MRIQVLDIVRGLLIAALAGVAWAPALETIEFDGFVTTFDPDQEFIVLEGDLDCSGFGGESAVRVTETSGRAGDADYLVYLPADWNGELVLFGHGAFGSMRPAGRFWFPLPLGFGPERAEMPFVFNRDVAVCHGFAWAASAITGSGNAIAEGIRDTHLLLAVAGRHLPAEPTARYVTGFDTPGGAVAVALAETYPHRYAGALVSFGPLGGGSSSGEHLFHIRVLFDAFFPGLIEPFTVDQAGMTPPEFMAFGRELQARLQAEPDALLRLARIRLPGSERWDPEGIGVPLLQADPFAPDEMASFMSLAEALFSSMNIWLLNVDAWRDRGGGVPYTNQDVVYASSDMTAEESADVNARVARVDADPWAVRYWTFYYHPSGDLKVPLVSVRPAHGAFSSVYHDWMYAQTVVRHGAEELFSSYPCAGYDMITPQDTATAFSGLVEWVRTGVRPTWPATP
jgi:hypothetical protein